MASGILAEPHIVDRVTDASGGLLYEAPRATLDIGSSHLSMIQEGLRGVVRLPDGTAHSLDSRDFPIPVMGKTGTTSDFHDALFVGSTYGRQGITVAVRIGFDDNRDLGLSGSQAAAPLWAEFMKRAVALPAYSKTEKFLPPEGLVAETIDPQSGKIATASCPQSEQSYFIYGSEPTQYCDVHGGLAGHLAQAPPVSWLAHVFGRPGNGNPPPPPIPPNSAASASNPSNKPRVKGSTGDSTEAASNDPVAKEPEKKKGLLDKIFGIFGGSKKPADSPKPQP